jgi:hypothetical protein
MEEEMKGKIMLKGLLLGLLILTACQLPATNQPEPVVLPTNTATERVEISEIPTEDVGISSTNTLVPDTPEPSETAFPTPTETIAASETPTLETTPTSDMPTTPDPAEGRGGIFYNDPFDGSTGWGWTYIEDGVVRFVPEAEGVLVIFEEANQGWRISLGPDTVSIGDQVVEITTRAEVCRDQDEWGLLFRGMFTEENRFNGYLIKMNCTGQVRMEILEENMGSVLLDWTAVEGVETGSGSENSLMVWTEGKEFRIYVNQTFVATVEDTTYDNGQYGIFGQDRSTGDAQFLFLSMQVYAVTIE